MKDSDKKQPHPSIQGTVVAGFPSPAEQYAEPPLDLNDFLVKHPTATYFMRVAGDSMEGAGILPGDIIVVDRSRDAHNGSIVIAAVDGEFTVKYYRQDKDGLRLEAANPNYAPIRPREGSEFDLFGVVTAVIRRVCS